MKEEINFSIIIPHKNIPNLLRRCLDSIPRRNDIQVVVIDDNSDTDKVDFENFPGVDEDCIEVYYINESKGAGNARNVGLTKAKGKWLIFADADDFFTSNFLELCDKYLNTDFDIIYFGIKSVLSENISIKASRGVNKFTRYFDMYCRNRIEGESLFRYKFTEPWAKMIKNSIVQDNYILFDETMVSNDYLFAVKIGYYGNKIFIDNKEMYVITLREGSLSFKCTDTLSKLLIRIEVACNVTNFLDIKKVPYSIHPLRGLYITAVKKYPLSIFYVTRYLLMRKINFFRLSKDIFLKREDVK